MTAFTDEEFAASADADGTKFGHSLLAAGRRPCPVLATSMEQRACKRILDVTVAGALLLVLSPVLVLVALAIVLDSRGSVFYRSARVGRNGKPLTMLKFRKMRDDLPGLPITTATDPRYTRIGRWLATSKLDEAPQLWNVLCGDMALVGPRPEDPQFVVEREHDYHAILQVPQGLTGLSQLAFYAESEILDPTDPMTHYRERIWPGKIALDSLYASRATIWWDLRILMWSARRAVFRTPVAVHRETGSLSPRRRSPTLS
jgi:lipopolysaccharide/colanic/teichoic acid biosynthesis glycosyltransferase